METIKEEKKAELKQILNSLVKLGWKPYGISRVKNVTLLNRYVSFSKRTILGIEIFEYTLRSLVSKESGLWQFVCENNLNYSEDDSIYNVWLKHYAEDDHESPYTYASPVWYLIESALKDESELEDFLLSNIKIDG